MKALVLAAGEGTRLRPLTLDRPKPMLPVAGRPLLEHLLLLLRHHGVRQIAINLHYRPGVIVDYFGDGARLGLEITYSYEEQVLGTAGAARKLAHFFPETFLVVYGDLLTGLDLSKLVAFHRTRRAQGTLALYEVPDPTERGIVEMDAQGMVRRFREKPRPEEVFSHLANAGIYVLEPEIIDYIPPDVPYDFGRDLFPQLLAAGKRLAGYPIQDYLLDIGSPEAYRRVEEDLRARKVTLIPTDRS